MSYSLNSLKGGLYGRFFSGTTFEDIKEDTRSLDYGPKSCTSKPHTSKLKPLKLTQAQVRPTRSERSDRNENLNAMRRVQSEIQLKEDWGVGI